MNNIKRIAMNTGGGDAPRDSMLSSMPPSMPRAIAAGKLWHPRRAGRFAEPENYPDGGLMNLTRAVVRDIAHLGDTILGTSNRGNPFKMRALRPDGSVKEIDRSDDVVCRFRGHRLEALISVGGEGTLGIARELNSKGVRVIGVVNARRRARTLQVARKPKSGQ